MYVMMNVMNMVVKLMLLLLCRGIEATGKQ